MDAANAKRVVTSVVVADALPAVRLAFKTKGPGSFRSQGLFSERDGSSLFAKVSFDS